MKSSWTDNIPVAVLMAICGFVGLLVRTAVGPFITYAIDRLKMKPVETGTARNDFEKNQQGHIDRLMAEIKEVNADNKAKEAEVALLTERAHKCELEAVRTQNTLLLELARKDEDLRNAEQKLKAHKFFGEGVSVEALEKFVAQRRRDEDQQNERRNSQTSNLQSPSGDGYAP